MTDAGEQGQASDERPARDLPDVRLDLRSGGWALILALPGRSGLCLSRHGH